MMVTTEDIADEIRTSLPGMEEIVVQYLAGYLLDLDDAAEDEDVLQITRKILASAVPSSSRQALSPHVDKVMEKLEKMLEEPLSKKAEKTQAGNNSGLVRLDKVMDMSKTTMSSTIAFSEGVDLESINKGK